MQQKHRPGEATRSQPNAPFSLRKNATNAEVECYRTASQAPTRRKLKHFEMHSSALTKSAWTSRRVSPQELRHLKQRKSQILQSWHPEAELQWTWNVTLGQRFPTQESRMLPMLDYSLDECRSSSSVYHTLIASLHPPPSCAGKTELFNTVYIFITLTESTHHSLVPFPLLRSLKSWYKRQTTAQKNKIQNEMKSVTLTFKLKKQNKLACFIQLKKGHFTGHKMWKGVNRSQHEEQNEEKTEKHQHHTSQLPWAIQVDQLTASLTWRGNHWKYVALV